ncbi:MAG: hypothetical protein AVDCRST_MAG88-2920, partial [uncultured Thermomicrobiales bacterium]
GAAPTPGAAPAVAPTAVTSAPAAPTVAATAEGVIPSPAPGVPEAYLRIPPSAKSVAGVPGKGGKVSSAIMSFLPPVPGRDQNRYWQELERRLGVSAYEANLIPSDAYKEKVTALVAGDTLPDLTFVEQLNAPELLRTINQGAFLDLTAELSGDGLKAYPNLAKIPDYAWKNVRIKGKIYGVPSPRFIPDRALLFRDDWAQKVGPAQPKNKDEFLQLARNLTAGDPDGDGQPNTYGVGSWGSMVLSLPFFQNMFRTPNEWRLNPDGTLTHTVETEEFKAAVGYVRSLWEARVFHPDSLSLSVQQTKDAFSGGKIGAYVDGWTALAGQRDTLRTRDAKLSASILVPPGHDGGKAVTDNSQGFFGFAAIPTKLGRDPERVKELLRVCDFFCAPFGSEEYSFLRYGLPGDHHELRNGLPVLTDRGRAEIGALANIARRNDVFFYPNYPEDARLMQGLCRDQMALGVDNPVISIFSPTYVSKAGELNQLRIDRVSAVVAGREPLSALDQYVRDWRSRGGDQMRKEYQDALKNP